MLRCDLFGLSRECLTQAITMSRLSRSISNAFPLLEQPPLSMHFFRKSNNRKNVRVGAADERRQEESSEDFEERLEKLRRKVSSGSGKKAERRKARKEAGPPSQSGAKSSSVLIAPVLLQDSTSDGLVVQLGFSAYAERLNGRLAALGLAALLLVELASGSSFWKYHQPAIVGLQIYTILAATAVFVKYEKEKISVWPNSN